MESPQPQQTSLDAQIEELWPIVMLRLRLVAVPAPGRNAPLILINPYKGERARTLRGVSCDDAHDTPLGVVATEAKQKRPFLGVALCLSKSP